MLFLIAMRSMVTRGRVPTALVAFLVLPSIVVAAPQVLAPGAPLTLSLTPDAPKAEVAVVNNGKRLAALRVAAAPNTLVRFRSRATAKFGAYSLTSDLPWEFRSERALSQLYDGLPQYPATWKIEVSLIGKEPRTITVQWEDQGAAPDVRWGEATGSLLIRNTGQTQLTAVNEKGVALKHPIFKGPITTVRPDITPEGDALLRLPAGYWQLVARGGTSARELRSALIPVSSGGETVVQWPQMRALEGENTRGLAELVLRGASADTETGQLLVAAPMIEKAPDPKSVRVLEGGQPGEVLSVESVPAKLHVVVLFDSSYSMKSIFAQAQNAALRFIETLSPETTVEFFDFDSQIRELPTTDRAALLKAMRNMRPDGGTRLYDSVLTGLTKTARHQRTAIVVFTDGFDEQTENPNKGSHAKPEEVFDAVSKSSVPLFTVGYGDKPDVETLSRLATASGGAYFRAQADTVADVFAQIGRIVSRDYRITYRRPAKIAASNTPVLTVVLDISGSMDMDPKGNTCCDYRIEKAKDLLRGFFRRLPAGSVVQLFTFSDNVDLVQVPTSDPGRLMRALGPITAGGGTETLQATQAALASLDKIPSQNRYLLFITDAALSVADKSKHKTFEQALAAIKDQGIRSLWVGMVDKKEEAPFVQAAALTGGTYVVSPGTDSLADALASLEKTLKQPRAGGNDVAVQALIDKQDAAGAHHIYSGAALFPLPSASVTAEQSVGGLTATIKNGAAVTATTTATDAIDVGSVGRTPNDSTELNRIPLQLAGHNEAVEIGVHDIRLFSRLHGLELPATHRFVVLGVTLKNLLPEQEVFVPDKGAAHPFNWVSTGRPPGQLRRAIPPYVIPDLRHHLFLRWNDSGESPTSMMSVLETPPIFLPSEPGVTVAPGQLINGNLVFLVQGTNLKSASLHFYDTKYGHFDLALVGPLSPRAEQLVALPTKASGALSDSFALQSLGFKDSADSVDGVSPGVGNVFRRVQLAFDARRQALLDVKPSAQFSMLIHTDKGLLSTPLAPLTDALPGGLYRELSLAPGSHNRFQQLYLLPSSLAARPAALFMALRDRDFTLPLDRPMPAAMAANNAAATRVAGLDLSVIVNDVFIVSKESGFGKPLLAVDVTAWDAEDKFSSQLSNLFSLTPPQVSATTKPAPVPEEAKRKGLSGFAVASPSKNALAPLATASEMLFGFTDITVIPDGASRRGVLLFDVPPAGDWRIMAAGQDLARIATPRNASAADQWLLARPPKYPLFDDRSALGRVETLVMDKRNQGVFRGVLRAGKQPPGVKTDINGRPNPVEVAPPRLTASGQQRWNKLLAASEQDLWQRLAALRVVQGSGKPWAASLAPEALLTQDQGTPADLANLAQQWFEAHGVKVERKQAPLSEAGKDWFKAHNAGEPPTNVPLLATLSGSWVIPFLTRDSDNAPLLAGAATDAGKIDAPSTELTVAVYCEPVSRTAAAKIGDAASALAGGSTGPRRIVLWSGRLPNTTLSRDAVDLLYYESGANRDRLVRARLETTDGIMLGTNGFNPTEWKPIREEISIRFFNDPPLPPAVREIPDGKLVDIFHSLALFAPDLPGHSAKALARLWRERKSADVPDRPSIMRWLARSKISSFLAAQTRWEAAQRKGLKVLLSRAAKPRAIVYTATAYNGALVQSLDLRQSEPKVSGDAVAVNAFRLMSGLTSAAFEGGLVGARSVLDIWQSPENFVGVAPSQRARFIQDLRQKGFPDEVLRRLKGGSEYLLFARYPVDLGGQPLWGWLTVDPTSYTVRSVLSTGENGAVEKSLLEKMVDAESFILGFFVGVDSSVWSVASFSLQGLPYDQVLQRAEAFAKKGMDNFSGIGVEPKGVAKIAWNKFSLWGQDYSAGDPGWGKFSVGYKIGVKYYFDLARDEYEDSDCYQDEEC